MQGGGREYRPVRQSWSFVHASATSPAATQDTRGGRSAPTARDFRERVQTARIERRWSLADLAAHARCTPDTLAAFERGDDILETHVKLRVCQILEL